MVFFRKLTEKIFTFSLVTKLFFFLRLKLRNSILFSRGSTCLYSIQLCKEKKSKTNMNKRALTNSITLIFFFQKVKVLMHMKKMN